MTPPTAEEALRREIADACALVGARCWVANHDGNLSARLPDGGFLATPTAVAKADVRPEMVLRLGADGKAVMAGGRGLFSEWALHAAAYAARPEIGVVLHAHPPQSTAFACAGVALPHPFLAEAVVSLGPEIPLVPFVAPGAPEFGEGVAAALGRADVVLLAQHGVLVVGATVEQALLRMELVEHLARIAAAALPLGGVRPLEPALVSRLAARGRPSSARPGAAAPEATSPVEASASPAAAGPSPVGRDEVSRLVADALRRLG